MNFFRFIGPVLTILPAFAMAEQPLIVAHRGASYTAPENTVSSAKLGFEHKADVLELDVHLTKDKKLIVIHDANTSRTAGTALEVEKTDAEELRKLDAGSWKNSRYAGEKLPFLSEMLATVPDGKKVFIEIKSSRDTVPYVRDAVKEWGKENQAVIIGFDIDVVTDAKKAMPNIPVFWLKGTKKDRKTGEYATYNTDIVQMVKERGLDGLDLQYHGVEKEIVDAAHKAGLQLHVWTVDDAEAAVRLKEMGVDSITTNRPDFIREAVFGKGAEGGEKKEKAETGSH